MTGNSRRIFQVFFFPEFFSVVNFCLVNDIFSSLACVQPRWRVCRGGIPIAGTFGIFSWNCQVIQYDIYQGMTCSGLVNWCFICAHLIKSCCTSLDTHDLIVHASTMVSLERSFMLPLLPCFIVKFKCMHLDDNMEIGGSEGERGEGAVMVHSMEGYFSVFYHAFWFYSEFVPLILNFNNIIPYFASIYTFLSLNLWFWHVRCHDCLGVPNNKSWGQLCLFLSKIVDFVRKNKEIETYLL